MPRPDLFAVSEEIQSRYRNPQPKDGVVACSGRFGFYTRHVYDPSIDSLLVDPLIIDQIPLLLDDIRTFFHSQPVRIYIDDRKLDHDLCAALENSGCARKYELIYLAHSEEATSVSLASGLTIENVTAETLREYEVAKIKGFANSEEEPDATEVSAHATSLGLDLQSGNRYLIGRLGVDAAAIIGWDEGNDRLVFDLATRVPFRNQGIAKHLLSYAITNTYKEGHRSITILTDPTDSPIQFYRKMGFTEEVYWQARYVYTPRT